MSDKEKRNTDGLPWLYQVEPVSADSASAELDPSSAVYRLFKNTRNPFLQRIVAPNIESAAPGSGEEGKLVRLLSEHRNYRVAPANDDPPLRRRQLQHPAPPVSPMARYRDIDDLPGDPTRLPVLVYQFFDSVLERLRKNPDLFYEVVDEITALAKKNRIRFRRYESYLNFEDWDDLMTTLEELAQYPGPETFSLFCSALLAYWELV